ncbi:putative F-box protein, partial [Dissostichus eleginoides]
MADREASPIPLEIRARLAELELELSEALRCNAACRAAQRAVWLLMPVISASCLCAFWACGADEGLAGLLDRSRLKLTGLSVMDVSVCLPLVVAE